MSLFKVFNVAGSALSAQSTRLNTIASNMANVDNASSTAEGVYRAKHPVFSTVFDQAGRATQGVRVVGIVESNEPPRVEYMPGHPQANEDGYVFFSAVNPIEEMADMMSAESTYRSNVELMSTVKQLMLRTLQIGSR